MDMGEHLLIIRLKKFTGIMDNSFSLTPFQFCAGTLQLSRLNAHVPYGHVALTISAYAPAKEKIGLAQKSVKRATAITRLSFR